MSLCVLTSLVLLLTPLLGSAFAFNLVLFSLAFLGLLSVQYRFSLFSSWSLNSTLFLLDEYGCTLIYIRVLVVYFRLLSYLRSYRDSKSKSTLLALLVMFMILASTLVFRGSSLLMVYLGYELSLVPIILIILIWGSYPERSISAIVMLFYTLVFSLPLMLVLGLLLGDPFSSTSLLVFGHLSPSLRSLGRVLPLVIFLAFAVKLPVYGLHRWLPIAHVEAPTFGSMLLAGLLLKLGGCGLYRFLVCFPGLFTGLASNLLSFLLVGIVASGLICSLQRDVKRLIAYSSVVHMTSVGVIYILDTPLAISASLILLVLHGISSPLIFYMVGELYNSSGTRSIMILRSMKFSHPLLYVGMIMAFYLTVPVPPSLSFLGELFLFRGLLKLSY